jgi:hypothetical protein
VAWTCRGDASLPSPRGLPGFGEIYLVSSRLRLSGNGEFTLHPVEKMRCLRIGPRVACREDKAGGAVGQFNSRSGPPKRRGSAMPPAPIGSCEV